MQGDHADEGPGLGIHRHGAAAEAGGQARQGHVACHRHVGADGGEDRLWPIDADCAGVISPIGRTETGIRSSFLGRGRWQVFLFFFNVQFLTREETGFFI